ncbi:PDZ-binding protein CRIPT [Penicillium cf. griseofulvum]|uniref:Cysteine-rich PDZ-binding protein n=1 Tax=Penicillium cf. griseofulvum TaxID=2972120 RepID=A0A9W9JP91_9EURO|nr:PDZ-binding protein CRIPT [Penicillium cf. griseofulvum]KAJ5423370.1 PDZ-binding protein CRIPT [Penicillium cf. griseofulvum]KAJ5431361.1 PDZ-binding protein CRIPT [Penicillium cf. griseofulvum]
MVCSKCQKKLKATELATPGVKNKNDMYYGSPSSKLGGADKGKAKATLGATGIGKSKLLSAKAKNPYAAYASSCDNCKVKTELGKKFCQRCAYQRNACAMCGKNLAGKSAKDQPIVQGQKFNMA